jgi:P-type E1-E2 ATPase
LESLASYLGKIGYFLGFLTFLILMVFLMIKVAVSDQSLLDTATALDIIRNFTTGLAIIIVAIPEGLPLAISISMAFSIDTMMKDNLLVKKIGACEELGFIKEICTGKTATLTKNDMTVNKICIGGSDIKKPIDSYLT